MMHTPGAMYLGDKQCRFVVWAPLAQKVEVHITDPDDRTVEMQPQRRGYYHATLEGIVPGSFYYFRLDDKTEKPDPASRSQPCGVHGPSQVVDPAFEWQDAKWEGLNLSDYILYEIHVGTFTDEGTFQAIIPHLDELKDLGITAIELMPVAQFPGSRNWGYDGVYPFAPQNSYGGPAGLKALVQACHERGLGVVLDVVYNHLGPEGNYLSLFGPYFTDHYHTPWGWAINFAGPQSDEVRRFFIENALYWIRDFHIDALRLDAIHAIVDPSAVPFLEELGMVMHAEAKRLGRKVYVIAESDRNDSRVISRREKGGYGLDAQWSDDFHHALHALLTGERTGYYRDFGTVADLAKAYREGFVYSGQFSVYRQRRHGNSSRSLPSRQFIVCSQNHDQIGNRMLGERLSQLIGFESLKLAAGLLLLSPYVPLLFMGEEYAEEAPFQYFTSHSDPSLIETVRKGRQQEFKAFEWKGEVPDPQDENTFQRCKLHRDLRHNGRHRVIYDFIRQLIKLRSHVPALVRKSKEDMQVISYEREKLLWVHRWDGCDHAIAVFNLGDMAAVAALPFPDMSLTKILDSSDQRWNGAGSSTPEVLAPGEGGLLQIAPKSFVLYHSE